MTRCALLPSRSDPITLYLVVHFFKTVWADEVDRLYVNINSLIEPEVVKFIEKFCDHPKIVFSYTDHSLDHGNSVTKMVNDSSEELVILIEDDSIIYGKGMVDKYAKMVESGGVDACGSLRWSCSGGLIDRARQYFNLWDEKYLAGGWYWPCFFFVKRSDLLKTDLDFRGKGWEPGEHIAPLQWDAREPERSDTMVWMSMQLRALGLRFHDFPNPNDVGNSDYQWTHIGSLSSFIESELTDNDNVPLAIRKQAAKYPVDTTLKGEKSEVEKKFAWMKLCLRKFDYSEIAEFRDLYNKAIDKFVTKHGLDMARIEGLASAFQGILGL